MTRIGEIEDELRLQGLEPGTVVYDLKLRVRKAELCREQQGVSGCRDCERVDFCTLAQEIVRTLRSGDPAEGPVGVALASLMDKG